MMALSGRPPGRNASRIALAFGAAAVGTSLLAAPAAASTGSETTTATAVTTTSDTTAATAATAVTASTAATTIAATSATLATAPAARAQTKAQKVIALAKKYSGKKYRWGAAGPNAFDCTGFTRFIYKKVGVRLPHSGAQGKKGKKVSRKNARPGDLVIFRNSAGRVFHVGIYAGGNKMYDAPTEGKKTGKHRIWSSHVEFRRVL
jgi:cell wall-associated NlpC family hydrolase